MRHPILKSIKNLVIYSIIWVIVAVVSFAIDFISFNSNFQLAITESLVFNAIFALLGIAIWYAVWYSSTKIGILNLIINHLSAASIIILIWLVSSFFIVRFILPDVLSDKLTKYITWYVIPGAIYYFIIVLVYYLIIYNHNLQEKHRNESKLMAMVKEAELNLLKSQINPHFLFNSLNSISSLTITNPVKAQDMIIKLSDFLRYSISGNNNPKSALKFELENIQRYLDIEKIRFGDKLNYQPDILPACLDKTLPVMILQPLYENAVKHGVYESTEQITLSTIGRMEGDFLSIVIRNNFDSEFKSRKGAGIGLKNIRERLILIYHSDGLLKTTVENNIFEVKLLIPQDEIL
jgi:sensor histidine kinase YesM